MIIKLHLIFLSVPHTSNSAYHPSTSFYFSSIPVHTSNIDRGRSMDELEDTPHNPTKPRRRSNSEAHGAGHALRTKFEIMEEQPVFEEEIHGASAADYHQMEEEDDFINKLEKHHTSSSVESVEDKE